MNDRLFRLDEINLRSLLQDLLRNFWVPILLGAALYLAVSAQGKMNYSPVYSSTATFAVSAKGNSSAYSSLSLTSNMAQVFSEVFQSQLMRERASEKLDIKQQDWRIQTNTVPNTNLMIVTVVSSSPEQSFLALRAVLDTYPDISELMFGNAVLQVIRDPKVPMAPSNSISNGADKQKAALLGAALGVAAIVALSALRDTVQTSTAAKRKIDGRLLRTVRHEEKNKTLRAKRSKKNIAPLITNPFVSPGFREDYQSLCSKVEYHMRKRGQKVVLVTSAGENEGKSTVAVNLALSLSQREKKVALIDCDFRKPAIHKILTLQPEKKKDFGHFISHDDTMDEVLKPHPKHKLHVAVNAARHKYPQRLISSKKMGEFLRQLRQDFDYIILDTPPMMVAADAEALVAHADTAVLVVREDWILARSVNDCMDTLRRSAPDLTGYVLNNCYMVKKDK